MNDTRDFTAHGAEDVSISTAQVGGQRPISTEQEANLLALAEVLGEDGGWLPWGPLLSKRGGKAAPKRPGWIDSNGRIQRDGWTELANTHSLKDILEWAGRTPEGGDGPPVQGAGFVFVEGSKANPLAVVLDFDACIEDGKPGEFAQEVLGRFGGTYCETSPSGTGLRIVCLADEAWKWPHKTDPKDLIGGGKVEVFTPSNSKGKFFRLSGNRWAENTAAVTEQGEVLRWLTSLLLAKEAGASGTGSGTGDSDDAAELLAQLQELAPFRRKKGWSDEAKEPKDVLRALQTLKGGQGGDSVAAKIMRNELGGVCNGDESKIDHAICCEAIRRGARTPEDVEAVWGDTPAWRPEKPGSTPGYVTRTITAAARAVLADARKADGGDGGNGGEPWRARTAALQAAVGGRLSTGKRGYLLPNPENLEAIMHHDEAFKGRARINEWSGLMEKGGDAPETWAEVDYTRIRTEIARTYKVTFKWSDLERAVNEAADTNRYNPVHEQLYKCREEWAADGRHRLATWLADYVAAATEFQGHDLRTYLARVGTLQLVAAVARAMTPGCKLDSQLVLIGGGGARKTTVLRTLAEALCKGLYTSYVGDLGAEPVKLAEAFTAKWIVELQEGASVNRAERAILKAMLEFRDATFRRAWVKQPEVWRARHVFMSTANDPDEFLRGNEDPLRRRFWVVRITADESNPIDTEKLARDARLLWGEAVAVWESMVAACGDREAVPLCISPEEAEAFKPWLVLRDEMADEHGENADRLQELRQAWLEGKTVRTRWHAVGEGLKEGCTVREIGTFLGLPAGGVNMWARTLARECKANKMHVIKSNGIRRVWATEHGPRAIHRRPNNLPQDWV